MGIPVMTMRAMTMRATIIPITTTPPMRIWRRTRSAAWMSIRTPRSTAPSTAGAPIISAAMAAAPSSLADPEKYLSGTKQAAAPVPEGTEYTCPMHPEIRQIGPGSCPICGMALEPVTVSLDSGPNPELADMTRRFWIGLALTVPVFALEMGAHLVPALHHLVPPNVSAWVQLVLATPVVLWAGWPFFERGWQSLVTRNLNMFTLIALGTGVAYLYSLVAVLAPGLFPAAFRGMDGAVAVYFEAAAVITVLVLLGQVLELRAREQTSGAIKALLDLAPKTARRLNADGSEEEVALDLVATGDRLRVRPGEKVPVDGTVEDGRSAIDESLVTGESMPVTKDTGDRVIGGTLNRSGGLVIRAEKVGRDTVLARIVQMVAEAQRSRAPIQRLADQVAGWFVPLVVACAVLAFIAWAVFGPEPRFTYALVAAVSVLIIACPCALGLATPMSIMVGVGRGAQLGVLIKNAEALERMEKVDTLVVDKTGTLTEGKPSLTRIVARERLRGGRIAAARRGGGAAVRASAGACHRHRRGGARHRHPAGARLRQPGRQGRLWHGRGQARGARQRCLPQGTRHRSVRAHRAGRRAARRRRQRHPHRGERQGRGGRARHRRPDQGDHGRGADRSWRRTASASSCSPATTAPPRRRWRASSASPRSRPRWRRSRSRR